MNIGTTLNESFTCPVSGYDAYHLPCKVKQYQSPVDYICRASLQGQSSKWVSCSWSIGWMQAIERRGTNISYGQLMYSMSEALEQLSAQQGKLPPKLPAQVGGLFGGLVNKLVSLCLLTIASGVVNGQLANFVSPSLPSGQCHADS